MHGVKKCRNMIIREACLSVFDCWIATTHSKTLWLKTVTIYLLTVRSEQFLSWSCLAWGLQYGCCHLKAPVRAGCSRDQSWGSTRRELHLLSSPAAGADFLTCRHLIPRAWEMQGFLRPGLRSHTVPFCPVLWSWQPQDQHRFKGLEIGTPLAGRCCCVFQGSCLQEIEWGGGKGHGCSHLCK